MKTGAQRNIALPIVCVDVELWSVVLTKELMLRVFQNRLLKKIFGPEKEMLKGDLRILHNAELPDFISHLNIIRVTKQRRMRYERHR